MSTSHDLHKPLQTEIDGDKVPRRLWVFLVLSLAMLSLQYPFGILRLHMALDVVVFALLVHSVVILVDVLCVVWLGNGHIRAREMLGYFIPTEGRGLPQLITLVACIGAMVAATTLHGLGNSTSYWRQ